MTLTKQENPRTACIYKRYSKESNFNVSNRTYTNVSALGKFLQAKLIVQVSPLANGAPGKKGYSFRTNFKNSGHPRTWINPKVAVSQCSMCFLLWEQTCGPQRCQISHTNHLRCVLNYLADTSKIVYRVEWHFAFFFDCVAEVEDRTGPRITRTC